MANPNAVFSALDQSKAYADANRLFKPVVLAAAADFNTLTVEGRTVVPTNEIAAACTNRPSANAGILDVALIGSGVFQTYRVFGFDLAYERQKLSNGTWTAWVQAASKSDLPLVNVYPNPSLGNKGATTYQATIIDESGVRVAQTTGATTQQIIYDVDAVGTYAIGATITLSADVFADVAGSGTSADVTIIALNSGGSTLAQTQTSISTANVYQNLSAALLIPASTTKVRFRFVKRSGASLAKFKNPLAFSTTAATLNLVASDEVRQEKVAYMSTTGSDTNSGSLQNPVLSFSKALTIVGECGKIIMRGGDYIGQGSSSGFNVAGVDKLHITTYKNEVVRVIQGNALSGVSKTGGYTNVYQAALTSTPTRYLWLHDVPDVLSLIDIADRHPLQRGNNYRLPSTKLHSVGSIALVDSESRPSFYYDSVAKIVYFSAPSGTNALTATFYAPNSNGFGLIYGGTGIESIKIDGKITVMYAGLRCIDARNLKRFEYDNIFAFGAKGQGIVLDDTLISVGNYARAAGNNDDGVNGHVYTLATQCLHRCDNLWTHDNGDDGESLHEYCVGSYFNILSESNGDRGAAPAYGAHCTYIGYVLQNNGRESDRDGGEGVACVGAATEGVGTQAVLFGGVSRGNYYNYRTSAADASMSVINGRSFDAITTAFDATVGRIEITDCGDSGSSVVKAGTVVVKNTTLVT